MTKTSVIWFAALGAAVVVLGLILAFPAQEPSYAGKPLSFWIDQLPVRLVMTDGYSEAMPEGYATRAEAEADNERLIRAVSEARAAVKNMGSQCLPFLLRRLSTRDESRFRLAVLRWGVRLHILKPFSRALRSAATLRGQALYALLILDRQASPAIPQLTVLANSTDQGVRLAARHALERLAPDELKRVRHE